MKIKYVFWITAIEHSLNFLAWVTIFRVII